MSKASTLLIPSQVAIHQQPLISASTILLSRMLKLSDEGPAALCPPLVRNRQEYKEDAMLTP